MQEMIESSLLIVVAILSIILLLIGQRPNSGMTKKQKIMLGRILTATVLLLVLQTLGSTIFDQLGAAGRWVRMAPSLGFLGTVIGMVQAFDKIQQVGDISPTVVAGGMKVALITTIFGLIVALILQVFYNYILSKIEALTSEMEDSSISLLDMVIKYDLKYKK